MTAVANALIHLRNVYPAFRPAERRVADTILEDPAQAVHLPISDLARLAQVSDATVVKFCKRMGYSGFQEFKILLAQDIAVKRTPIYGKVEEDDDVLTITEKIFQDNVTALQNTVQAVNEAAMERAVELLAAAGEIHFYGVGASGIVALDAEQKFSRIGLRVKALVDAHMQITRAVLLGPGDVVVALSYSGETEEIRESLLTAKHVGAATIAITNYSLSSVAKAADLVLLTASQETLLRSAAISSRIAQLSIIDALFIAVFLVDKNRSMQAIEKTKEALSRRKSVRPERWG